MIDVRTRFDSCRRIAKATGVSPKERNANQTVADMKAMIRELSNHGDEFTLLKIKNDQLTLLDALKYWRQGRLDVADGDGHKPLLSELKQFNATANIAESTRKARKTTLNLLVRRGYVRNDTKVASLSNILSAIRDDIEISRKYDQFSQIRTYFLAFITKYLKHKHSSNLYRACAELQPFPVLQRRDHHPFESPRDMLSFLREIDKQVTIPAKYRQKYRDAVYMNCLHGFRATEFNDAKYCIDSKAYTGTGHLRILGTKTALAERVVPLVVSPSQVDPIRIGYGSFHRVLQRISRNVRQRDFRRTYAIWLEAAGIPVSRQRMYLGHTYETMTQRYQQRRINKQLLDEDANTLRTWFNEQIATAPEKHTVRKGNFVTTEEEIAEAESISLEATYRAIAKPFPWDTEKRDGTDD